MIECIFTIDYEIYGNGEGSLKELVYEPAQKLVDIFDNAGAKIVVFIEAAELEQIEVFETDSAINNVKYQVKELYRQEHEIALHLHPQWYKGKYKNSKWGLDNSEYNLCVLSEQRVAEIVDHSIHYLRSVVSDLDYTPLSFRAGNWLFQPTQPAAKILNSRGIKIDSSVFKGGLQHQHNLDYRPALRNGYFWKFHNNINTPDDNGTLMEIPIYSQMVPFWQMATKKRLGLQKKASPGTKISTQKINRFLDLLRFRQPLKFDFCRMTINELIRTVEKVIKEDQHDPLSYKPLVAIGHTKDLVDFKTVVSFLSYLKEKNIKIVTFEEVYEKCI